MQSDGILDLFKAPRDNSSFSIADIGPQRNPFNVTVPVFCPPLALELTSAQIPRSLCPGAGSEHPQKSRGLLLLTCSFPFEDPMLCSFVLQNMIPFGTGAIFRRLLFSPRAVIIYLYITFVGPLSFCPRNSYSGVLKPPP